jgi:ABC-type Zn uptake system ZnuABC Zn-binding protein ZnuA
VLSLFFETTVEEQILKKLSKKIQDKIVSKTVPDDSVSTKDNEAAMNANVMSTVHGKMKIDVTLIPASYPFS